MTLDLLDLVKICALGILGFWLEGIGGKHGLLDELLAPLPLGLGGVMLVLCERIAA